MVRQALPSRFFLAAWLNPLDQKRIKSNKCAIQGGICSVSQDFFSQLMQETSSSLRDPVPAALPHPRRRGRSVGIGASAAGSGGRVGNSWSEESPIPMEMAIPPLAFHILSLRALTTCLYLFNSIYQAWMMLNTDMNMYEHDFQANSPGLDRSSWPCPL